MGFGKSESCARHHCELGQVDHQRAKWPLSRFGRGFDFAQGRLGKPTVKRVRPKSRKKLLFQSNSKQVIDDQQALGRSPVS